LRLHKIEVLLLICNALHSCGHSHCKPACIFSSNLPVVIQFSIGIPKGCLS